VPTVSGKDKFFIKLEVLIAEAGEFKRRIIFMKPDRFLSLIALVMSAASLGYAVWLHQNINLIAQAALRQREAELVHHFAPNVLELYRGLGVAENKIPKSPQTLEQLFQPAFDLSNLVNAPDEPAQSSDTVTNAK